MRTVAIVPAAGRGERMGQDKALLDLAGEPAIGRVVASCRAAGVDEILVVRREGAAALPSDLGVRTIVVPPGGEMADSLRAAERALPGDIDAVVVFPVDHALVAAETVVALTATLQRAGCAIALPLFRGRPGHPIALTRSAFAEIQREGVVLRDLVKRDPERVRALPSANPWVHADLDHPEDHRAAVCALHGEPWSTVAQMFRHRSHRAYRSEPVAVERIERMVDAARHASTSSFIQAYSVICVRDPVQKGHCARLCAGQPHIAQAPVFFAVCADLHKIARSCQRHATDLQAQSFELFLQATVDAALLGQNLQLAAEAEGLGACMIGAARNHPVELAALLGLPAHVYVVFGMTMGIPADDPIPRGRMPLAGVLHLERYDVGASDAALDGADAGMRAWSQRTNAERGGYQGRPVNTTKGWTERMAALWGADSEYVRARATLWEELQRLGFMPPGH
jgi:FMN reductase (NADPH)